MLPPNQEIAQGKEAIRKVLGDLMGMPGFAVSWSPTKVEASREGDMGYTMGSYELTVNDPKGNPIKDRGKYLTLWKKQTDGSWKVAIDIFNTDLALPAGN